MSSVNDPVADAPETNKQPERPRAVIPEKTIEGFITLQTGQDNSNRGAGGKRMSHYMHGMILPGWGKGRDRRTGQEIAVPRNRMLLPDKQSYPWFEELLAQPTIPAELEDLEIRVHVRHLLGENIAFVRPSARTIEQVQMESKTRLFQRQQATISNVGVHDTRSLNLVFYTRAFKNHSDGTIARILPNQMKALVVMRNGFFYELSGAERLKQHIGRAGTNGMLLDRDIESVIQHRQLYDLDLINAMLEDPTGFQPLI